MPSFPLGSYKESIIIALERPWFGRFLRTSFEICSLIFRRLGVLAEKLIPKLPYARKVESIPNPKKLFHASLYFDHLRALVASFPYQPKISVLVPVYKPDPQFFEQCLRSVEQQIYENWELCIVDDQSNDSRLTAIIDEVRRRHPNKVKFGSNQVNSHISVTSNHCLDLATGDYVALLDHDDRLYPNALAEIVRYILLRNEPEILYSDERTIDAQGEKLHQAYYKPDWSPFMHLSVNYTTHLSVYRTQLIRDIGGFRQGFEGSQDHDLMLRAVEATSKPIVHVPFCLYQWRAHAASTASTVAAKPYAAIAGEKAVGEALARRNRPAKVEYEPHTYHYRLKFELPKPPPLVSIVIPSCDKVDFLRACLESIESKTSYENWEIIISDNGSKETATHDLYKEWRGKLSGRFRTLVQPRPFNFAKQINDGVRAASGEFVLLLNNDTEIVTPEWMEEMLQLAQFPEVGAVGAKLLFDDDTVQHAGVITIPLEIAVHIGFERPANDNLYCNVLNTLHECVAVTAACLLISKEKFQRLGGLNEALLPNGYGDLDFCLRLREQGFSNLFTPYARLIHHESKTRGKTIENFEIFYLRERWANSLLRDPYLNHNLRADSSFRQDGLADALDFNAREFNFFLNQERHEWTPRAKRAYLAQKVLFPRRALR